MNTFKIGILGLMVAGFSSACTAEAPEATEAPVAVDDALDVLDEGASYNGWTQSIVAWSYVGMTMATLDHTFTRSWGDSTRGGGACWAYSTGAGCSSDTTCTTAAKAQYGTAAYGYCYAGSCYSRPGSAPAHCMQSSSRTPGTASKSTSGSYHEGAFIIGCMTKAAGPSADCGSTNTALYMRLGQWANISYDAP